MNSGTLNSGNLNSGTLNSGTLNSGTLNSGTLNSGNLNSVTLNSGTLNSGTSNQITKCLLRSEQHVLTGDSELWDPSVPSLGPLQPQRTGYRRRRCHGQTMVGISLHTFLHMIYNRPLNTLRSPAS